MPENEEASPSPSQSDRIEAKLDEALDLLRTIAPMAEAFKGFSEAFGASSGQGINLLAGIPGLSS
jgi:hypothetical protein